MRIVKNLLINRTLNTLNNSKSFLIEGPIPVSFVADSIAKHQKKQAIGAHTIFLGQVRADVINNQKVTSIEYSAHNHMAEQAMANVREVVLAKFKLSCMHIYHSIGLVRAGEICFFVFVSAPRRGLLYRALEFAVEEVKEKVPVFGKEILEDGTYFWKENTSRNIKPGI